MIREFLLANEPIPLGNELFFHPPSLRELLLSQEFYTYAIFLLMQKEHFELDESVELSIFEIILLLVSAEIEDGEKIEFTSQLNGAFEMFMKQTLWFSNGEVGYLGYTLTDSQWNQISEIIAMYFDISISELKKSLAKPVYANEKAREMAERAKATREEVERIKAKSTKKESSDSKETYFSSMVKHVSQFCAKSNNINIIQVWGLNYFQYFNQFQDLLKIESYENSTQAVMAGAKIVGLKHWSEIINN